MEKNEVSLTREQIRSVIRLFKNCPYQHWFDIPDEDATESDLEEMQIEYIIRNLLS